MTLGIYDMPEAEYHADPAPVPSLSSSIARLLIERSPLHAWMAHPKLNPAYQPEEAAKFDIGAAAHALLLEGEDKMVICDFEDWRKKEDREQRDAIRAEGKLPILAHQSEAIYAMLEVAYAAIRNCSDLSGMTLADGKAEQTIVWQERGPTVQAEIGDEALEVMTEETVSYLEKMADKMNPLVWCRARPDWLANDRSLMLDYKSTAASAEPDAWTRTMVGRSGDIQPAFYLRGLKAVEPQADPKFVFMVQEIEPPYAVSFIGMPPPFIALGADKVETAITIWRECMASGKWPAYPNRICWPDVPAYAQQRWLDRVPAEAGGDNGHYEKLFGGIKK